MWLGKCEVTKLMQKQPRNSESSPKNVVNYDFQIPRNVEESLKREAAEKALFFTDMCQLSKLINFN